VAKITKTDIRNAAVVGLCIGVASLLIKVWTKPKGT